MSEFYEKVKSYLLELEFDVLHENPADQLFIIDDEESGIKNLIIDCEDPILILEQLIMPIPVHPGELFKRLLQINRTLVHGAFVLDESGTRLFFRDTLQLANLDRNELEGSIYALELALAENSAELLEFAKQ
ncbi:MAG: YbjN domain-containing protein [Trueperaceae bacterium]|nr:MAG: YbjN domain-containing protein [Trueperaceae bacterium]